MSLVLTVLRRIQTRPRWFIVVGSLAFLLGGFFLVVRGNNKEAASMLVQPKYGDFVINVTTTGELKAKKFVQIQGPENMMAAEVYQTKISSLVQEGTVVKAGEQVAELDRSSITSKMTESNLALQKAESQQTQAQIDTTLDLSAAREEIRTAEYTLEERRLASEQATYEAPSIKRQAEIELEKAKRALDQSRKNYQTKLQKAAAKMREVGADVERFRNKLAMITNVMERFTIKAPADGMVIYAKDWNGKKRVVGSQVSAWEPTVATLPDLSLMESITFVNKIDIRKIAVGQDVVIALDSDPTKKLVGKITAVANVGEQRPNSDSKVFEVKIDVLNSDTSLRPGMTTSNMILTNTIKNVLFVPLECLHTAQNMTFVYTKTATGVARQQVKIGLVNDNEAIVEQGLSRADVLYLSVPQGAETTSLVQLNK
jgi:multidrug efflux pump subunit AcrA (membrane-fusion protein)